MATTTAQNKTNNGVQPPPAPCNPPSLLPPALARVATQLETFHGDGDGGGTLDFLGDFGFLKLPKGQSRSRHLQP